MLKSNRFSMFAVLGATSAISLVSAIAAASPNFVMSDRIQPPNSKVAQLNEPQVSAGCSTPACEKP
ncbi:MAG: hypothetical protein IGS48_14400 [Oscillatoriales cyanobacterium C42_A2020_001]|nr:hypothetical protein [Leptolyngbyaceae cyanobacterium C42_A2020_001]